VKLSEAALGLVEAVERRVARVGHLRGVLGDGEPRQDLELQGGILERQETRRAQVLDGLGQAVLAEGLRSRVLEHEARLLSGDDARAGDGQNRRREGRPAAVAPPRRSPASRYAWHFGSAAKERAIRGPTLRPSAPALSSPWPSSS
jgi:hypothetical protein